MVMTMLSFNIFDENQIVVLVVCIRILNLFSHSLLIIEPYYRDGLIKSSASSIVICSYLPNNLPHRHL